MSERGVTFVEKGGYICQIALSQIIKYQSVTRAKKA